jgi:hypothetical protein
LNPVSEQGIALEPLARQTRTSSGVTMIRPVLEPGRSNVGLLCGKLGDLIGQRDGVPLPRCWRIGWEWVSPVATLRRPVSDLRSHIETAVFHNPLTI